MKYLLISYGEGNDPATLTICDTPEAREKATCQAIYGDESVNVDACPEIPQLRDDKIIYFEGDPPLQWVDVAAIRGAGWECKC